MWSRFDLNLSGRGSLCLLLILAAAGPAAPETEKQARSLSPAAVANSGPTRNSAGEMIGRRSLRWRDRVDLTLPYGYTPTAPVERLCHGPDFTARFYAARYAQGNAVYVEVLPKAEPESAEDATAFPADLYFRMYFDSKRVPLRRKAYGFRGFFPIGPRTKAGPRTALFVTEQGQRPRRFSCPMPVAPTKFPVYRSSMNLGKFSNANSARDPAAIALIKRSTARKRQVFARRSNDTIRARMAHPRDMHKVTSPYYSTRIKQVYTIKNGKKVFRKPRVNIHRGLDLKGLNGAPIFALLDGVVAAAEPMYWEGNHTILDHGDGIFTVYMHQSAMLVKAGQRIGAGDLIGRTGATGAVTGPHLHIALYMRGVPIQPLSFLSLPVRD